MPQNRRDLIKQALAQCGKDGNQRIIDHIKAGEPVLLNGSIVNYCYVTSRTVY